MSLGGLRRRSENDLRQVRIGVFVQDRVDLGRRRRVESPGEVEVASMWKNLADLSDNKIQSTIARELGVSRQCFSRQVVSLQRTLGIRSHTMRAGRG